MRKQAIVVLLVLGLFEAAFWIYTATEKHKKTNGQEGDDSSSTSTSGPELSLADRDHAATISADGGMARHRIDPLKARTERDALRERIYRAFGEAPPDPNQPRAAAQNAAPRALFMPETEAGTIDPSYIQARVHDDLFPLAMECYGELMARHPDAGGRLEIDFTIVGDPSVGGIVEDAELTDASTLTDRTMAECVRQSMLSMTFAPPPHGGKVTVTYPIDFAPDED